MSLVPFPRLRRTASLAQPSENAQPGSETDSTEPDESEEPGARMSFLEHLDELRRRLIVSVAAIGVACLLSFAFIQQLYDFVMRPLAEMLPKGSSVGLIYTEPTEAFVLYLKIALLAGVFLASPIVLWQVWLFVAPGLYAKEKRFAIPFIVLATIGFVGGAAFSHYLLFRWTWRFLASFAQPGYLMFMPKIESVFSLYVKMLLGMGVIFQMPTIVYFLARMGVVTAGFLLRHFKYAVLLIFIVAAVITPTGDMLTQLLFAAPMLGLYLISIVIAWVCGRQRAGQESA
jgi:sec-independent protein translocase protein TatC